MTASSNAPKNTVEDQKGNLVKKDSRQNQKAGSGPRIGRAQIICAILAIVVVFIFVPFTWETQKLMAYFRSYDSGNYKWPEVGDLWFAAVTAVTSLIFEKIIEEVCYPYYYRMCKEKNDEKIRDRRTRKGVKNIYKCCYFIFASFFGWYTLKDSFILPPSLGGNGSLYNTFQTFPTVKFPELYPLYFTGTMGYHVAGLISHFFEKNKSNDYAEMMFHHLVTFYLYAFSYLTNTFIGGVVALIHDIGDIFISFTRIWAETEYKQTTGVSFVIALIVWVHTRLYVFPMCIYVATYKLEVYAASPYLKPIFGFLMTCLYILHIYWFILCLKILKSFIITGNNEDLQNNMQQSHQQKTTPIKQKVLQNGKKSKKGEEKLE